MENSILLTRVNYLYGSTLNILNQLEILNRYSFNYSISDERYYIKNALVTSVIINTSKIFDGGSATSILRILSKALNDEDLFRKDYESMIKLKLLYSNIRHRKIVVDDVFKYRNSLVAHIDTYRVDNNIEHIECNFDVSTLKSLVGLASESMYILSNVLNT